jgi:hypothetical protein
MGVTRAAGALDDAEVRAADQTKPNLLSAEVDVAIAVARG